jgi:hypothetical protein
MAIQSMELRNPPHSLAFSIALKKNFNGDGGLRDICTVDLYWRSGGSPLNLVNSRNA